MKQHFQSTTISPSRSAILRCDLNFSFRPEIGQLQPLGSLSEKLQTILKHAEDYSCVLHDNGSVARQQGAPLFRDKMEAKINDSFSCSFPPTEELRDEQAYRGAFPKWVELIQANLCSIKSSHDGKYRCRVRDFLVEISEDDRNALCSPFLQNLLGKPDPEDVQKEQESRSTLRAEVNQMERDVLQLLANLQAIRRSLHCDDEIGSFEARPLPSALAPPEQRQNSCDIMTPADPASNSPAIYNEYFNEVENASMGLSREQASQHATKLDLPQSDAEHLPTERDAMRYKRNIHERQSSSKKEESARFMRDCEDQPGREKVDEYRLTSGKRRSRGSIKKQDSRMGFDMFDGKRKRPKTSHQRLLVLKVPAILPDECYTSCEREFDCHATLADNQKEQNHHAEPDLSMGSTCQQRSKSSCVSDTSSVENHITLSTENAASSGTYNQIYQSQDECPRLEEIAPWNRSTLGQILN